MTILSHFPSLFLSLVLLIHLTGLLNPHLLHMVLQVLLFLLLWLPLWSHKLIILTQPQLTVLCRAASKCLPCLGQKNSKECSRCHFNDVLASKFLDFHWKCLRVEVTHTQLALIVLAPCVIHKIFALFYFCHSMIPSTPHICHISKPNSVKSQTVLSFSPLVDSPSRSKRFRLPSTKDPVIDQNASMIGAWHQFLNWLVLVTDVQRYCSELDWNGDILHHLFSSQVIVVSCEEYDSIDAVSKHGMVVTCWNQIYWVIQFYLEGNALWTFSAQSALIITAESVCFPVTGQYDRVEAATGNFDDAFLEDGVGVNVIFLVFVFGVFFIVIVEIKVFDVSETDGSFGLGEFVGVSELVGLAGAVDVEFHEEFLFGFGFGFLLWEGFDFYFLLMFFDLDFLGFSFGCDLEFLFAGLHSWCLLLLINLRIINFLNYGPLYLTHAHTFHLCMLIFAHQLFNYLFYICSFIFILQFL